MTTGYRGPMGVVHTLHPCQGTPVMRREIIFQLKLETNTHLLSPGRQTTTHVHYPERPLTTIKPTLFNTIPIPILTAINHGYKLPLKTQTLLTRIIPVT